MSPELKQRIQIVLAAAILIAGVRSAYILYPRHAENLEAASKTAPPLNPDYYVTPKKLYPYDLKSALQLTQQPVWVKEGYRYTYYPFVPVAKTVDFAHEMGTLGPIERLDIKDVLVVAAPGGRKQVVATFEKDGHIFAVPIGFESDGQYKIYSDEMFYIQDPHELYKHWPPDVWQAISNHQIKPGMDELQAVFAVGMGVPDAGATDESKTVHYPNGGKPLSVTYSDGKAAEIKAGA